MKKFDAEYQLLEGMRQDAYFPDFLVGKIEGLLKTVIDFLEMGERDLVAVQAKLDEMTAAINTMQEEFEENDSELETAARESIAETVEYVLRWFQIELDVEDALREREW